ncbi:uncharacterized protein LOC117642527 isoform X1 [Thrips palmi]|uniref:Uncharacterized protein LOC117642527 isoform X1 n=1 Tax=Thrips palmi TaxID=161013 RepID=A0A6P8YI49_THRPL|nr:uncharacterized protein LOC117642527 isoform X1 [Thrips palmi]
MGLHDFPKSTIQIFQVSSQGVLVDFSPACWPYCERPAGFLLVDSNVGMDLQNFPTVDKLQISELHHGQQWPQGILTTEVEFCGGQINGMGVDVTMGASFNKPCSTTGDCMNLPELERAHSPLKEGIWTEYTEVEFCGGQINGVGVDVAMGASFNKPCSTTGDCMNLPELERAHSPLKEGIWTEYTEVEFCGGQINGVGVDVAMGASFNKPCSTTGDCINLPELERAHSPLKEGIWTEYTDDL